MNYPFDGDLRIVITTEKITAYRYDPTPSAWYEECNGVIGPAFVSLERYNAYTGWRVIQETFKTADGEFYPDKQIEQRGPKFSRRTSEAQQA